MDMTGKPPRTFQVTLTSAARRALDRRTEPLVIEMELLFSCLIRKRLRWDTNVPADAIVMPDPDHSMLRVWFHPVVSQHCALPEGNDTQAWPLTEFPLARKTAFTPRWLRLDYRGGRFQGDFGW